MRPSITLLYWTCKQPIRSKRRYIFSSTHGVKPRLRQYLNTRLSWLWHTTVKFQTWIKIFTPTSAVHYIIHNTCTHAIILTVSLQGSTNESLRHTQRSYSSPLTLLHTHKQISCGETDKPDFQLDGVGTGLVSSRYNTAKTRRHLLRTDRWYKVKSAFFTKLNPHCNEILYYRLLRRDAVQFGRTVKSCQKTEYSSVLSYTAMSVVNSYRRFGRTVLHVSSTSSHSKRQFLFILRCKMWMHNWRSSVVTLLIQIVRENFALWVTRSLTVWRKYAHM